MMKKRVLSLLLAVAMCLGLVGPVSAAETGDTASGVTIDIADNPVGAVTAAAKAGGEENQVTSPEETVYVNLMDTEERSVNFDANWRFYLGEADGAENPLFNDSAWRDVQLPHDYSIEQEFTRAGEGESAFLLGGTGWYRKAFLLPENLEGKVISVDFGGVYMNSTVWINGTKLGTHPYGYTPFSFILPSKSLHFGGERNVLTVKVEHQVPSSRWYSGSGIYRSVNLTVTNPVHVARYGTTVTTPDLETSGGVDGTVNVVTAVQNHSEAAANVSVRHSLMDGEITVVTGEATVTQAIEAGAELEIETSIKAENPHLWSIESPNLYTLKTEVLVGEEVTDTYETKFGFRYFKFDPNEGFLLNGEHMKLNGVCMHHDQGALGAEAWYRATERQVEILQEMGVNAIRVSHNPASDVLIDICNEKGVLLVEEAFDTWLYNKGGNIHDYGSWFTVPIEEGNTIQGGKPGDMTWAEFDIKAMAGRGKNAPSIIMWSIGNELEGGHGGDVSSYPTIAHKVCQWLAEVDATRPPTIGENYLRMDNALSIKMAQALQEEGGVIGYNYADQDYWDGAMDKHHARYPEWRIYGAETASTINSRGVYDRKESGKDINGDKRLTSYDKSRVGWGSEASRTLYNVISKDFNAGEFVWTGFDYLGEPTPWGNATPDDGSEWIEPKSSYFGMTDTTGFPKDTFYLRQSQWNKDVTTLHLLPTWDRDDIMLDASGKVEVVVYTSAPQIKLFLNGKEVGTAKSNTKQSKSGYPNDKNPGIYEYRMFEEGTGTFNKKSGYESLYATFWVPYEEGTLEVRAYDENGNQITETTGRSVVKTTGPAKTLRVTADRAAIDADGKDLSYITIAVTDKDGNIVNSAKNEVTVSIEGNGKIVGVDNGVQSDHTSYQRTTRKAAAGDLLAIVQSTKDAGSFTLTATAHGLEAGGVTVATSEVTGGAGQEKQLFSYSLIQNYYLKKGATPALQESSALTYSDRTTGTAAITWDEIASDDLNRVGQFTVSGRLGDTGIVVVANVIVLDEVVALLNYSTAVVVGGTPNLPQTRPAVLADGTVLQNAQFSVQWDEAQIEAIDEAGIYLIDGTAGVFGESLAVTASVRVADGENVVTVNRADRADRVYLNDVQGAKEIDCLTDGKTGVSDGAWSGTGSIVFDYNTAFMLKEVRLYIKDPAPTSDSIKLYGNLGEGLEWTPIKDGLTIKNENSGGVTKRTFSFDAVRAVQIKLEFDKRITLIETELMDSVPSFPIGSSDALDSLNIQGLVVDDVSLEERVYSTTLTAVDPEKIAAVTADNASVTILPAVDEGGTDTIRILTESEDGSLMGMYRVLLGQHSEGRLDAADASRDYPYSKTMATALSWHGGTGNEGGPALAVDGKPETHWHTRWGDSGEGDKDLSALPEKRYIQLELAEATELNALRYLPRTGPNNGLVGKYRVMVSTTGGDDPGSWTEVSTGEWPNDKDWKIAQFNEAVTAKFVRLYGVSTYGKKDNENMTCGEIRVCTPPANTFTGDCSVELTPNEFDYTGSAVTPKPVVRYKANAQDAGTELTLGTDYTLSYKNNVNPGEATVYVSGTGEYQGILSSTFTIKGANIVLSEFDKLTVTVTIGSYPVLPGVVTGTTNIGTTEVYEVDWDEIPSDSINTVGKFEVLGTVAGVEQRPVFKINVIPGIGNVALGKKATASSEKPSDNNRVPKHLTDGNYKTEWGASANTYPQWIMVDLGRVYDITSFNSHFFIYNDRTYQYEIYTSDSDEDNLSEASETFELRVDGGDNSTIGTAIDEAPAGTRARYVKVLVTGAKPSGTAIMYEFEVMGAVSALPDITTQPQDQTVARGETAAFSVAVAEPLDGGTVSYQWQKNGDEGWTDIDEAAGASYTTPATTLADDGTQFRCVITNTTEEWDATSATTEAALLTVDDGIYDVTTADTENGEVTADPVSAAAGTEITLTIAPADGYELDILTVTKTDDTTTVDISGSGNTRAFIMPGFGVTVTASFKKTDDQIAVEAAKGMVEGGTYTVAQAAAQTDTDVETWLAGAIANLDGMSATGVAVGDITVTDFVEAVADTDENATGRNGSFAFTATITKGDSTATTDSVSGIITKTPYTPEGKTAKPVFVLNTQTFAGADVKTVNFTLAGDPAAATYKAYDEEAAETESAGVTVALQGDKVTLTFTEQPGTETIYYIGATEGAKDESDRTAVTVKPYEAPKSSEKKITSFTIADQTGNTVIDETNHTIVVTMPDGTAITALAPTIEVSEHAKVDPASEVAQDFTAPVTYTVTAENDTTQRYTVTVMVEEPTPVTHTVTFHSNGGSAVASVTVNDGEKVAKPANPTRSSYDFVGWYSDEELTAAYGFNSAVTDDLTLYAKWEKREEPSYTPPPSNTTTETEKNEDGSTTKTVTDKKTGNVTETTTYPDGTKIVATTPKGGETSIEVSVPKGKDSVTVTIPTDKQPAPGEVAVIIREDGTREIIKTSVSTEDGLRVTLTGNAKLEIIDNSKSFADVPASHWGADAIAFVTSRELFNGGDGGFQPAGDMSRAMLFTVLARLDGQDLTGGETWYENAMLWAKENDVSDGTNPNASISREQLAVMLYRYAKAEKTETDLKDFSDAGSVSDWAAEAMAWAVENGIITGKGGALDPQGNASRVEVAAMLMRFIAQ